MTTTLQSYPPPPIVDPLVRRVAARICARRHWPYNLEPGDAYGVDAILANDDPAHEMWREYVDDAEKVVAMVRATDGVNSLLDALDKSYGITSHLIGNGCEHGFKPASSCPNKDCEDRQLHILWKRAGR